MGNKQYKHKNAYNWNLLLCFIEKYKNTMRIKHSVKTIKVVYANQFCSYISIISLLHQIQISKNGLTYTNTNITSRIYIVKLYTICFLSLLPLFEFSLKSVAFIPYLISVRE